MALMKLTSEFIDVEVLAYMKLMGFMVNNIGAGKCNVNAYISVYSNSKKKSVIASEIFSIEDIPETLCNFPSIYNFLKKDKFVDWQDC